MIRQLCRRIARVFGGQGGVRNLAVIFIIVAGLLLACCFVLVAVAGVTPGGLLAGSSTPTPTSSVVVIVSPSPSPTDTPTPAPNPSPSPSPTPTTGGGSGVTPTPSPTP